MKRMILGVTAGLILGFAPASRADGEAEFKSGDTVYFFNIREGKWAKASFFVKFPNGSAGIQAGDDRTTIPYPLLISEEAAKKRGVHEDSSAEDRDRYVESVHADAPEVHSDSALVRGVVLEHNEIRRNPKEYSKKVEAEFKELQEKGDLDEVTKKAYETCIADLQAARPMLPLALSAEGSKYTTSSLSLDGKHDDPRKIGEGWEKEGFAFAGLMLKFGGESIFGMDGLKDEEAVGRGAVRALLVDGGKNNEGKYGHRLSILNFQSVSVDVPARNRKEYRHVGIASNDKHVYIQYVCGQQAAEDK